MAVLLTEKDRLAKAKALQNRSETITSPPKLQNLCFDFYIGIAQKIVSKRNKPGENIFDQLPNTLRNGMLSYLLSEEAHEKVGNKEKLKKHMYNLIYMLMNETTAKLDYEVYKQKTLYRHNATWLTSFQEFKEILANAAVKCPKLEFLAVHNFEENDIQLCFERAKNSMAPRTKGIHLLLQLEQLRHLDIFGLWYWTDDGLIKLFSQLKKLITLKILIHSSATVKGFQNIHLLKELEEFHFVVGNPNDDSSDSYRFARHYEFIYSFCAQNVPSLKLIGAPTNDCADDENFNSKCHLRHITPKIEGTSKLEHLHSNRTLPAAEFPNLQHLYFIGPITPPRGDKFFQKFGTFTRLTTLNLGGLNSDVIAKMLELVGKKLNTLSINLGEDEEPGDLFQILHLCPNLVSFTHNEGWHEDRIDEVDRVDPPSKYETLVTEHNVRLLEYFQANFNGRFGGKDRLFELILFAPLLKHLRLLCISITKSQCQLFHNVEEGKLNNLCSLMIDDIDCDPSCSMDDVALMVQCLVSSAPRLNFLVFFWRDLDMFDKWENEQIVAQSLMELLMANYETYKRFF